jgi:hypothetical protein
MSLAVESDQVTPVDDRARDPRRRGAGPRSKLVLYALWIERWLREDPKLSSAQVLHRVRALGYRGGKSALYELVRRLRLLSGIILTGGNLWLFPEIMM